MNCMTGITDLSQIITYTLRGFAFKNCFVRIFADTKIMLAHSRQNLKLCIDSSCPHSRHCQLSIRILLLQPMEIRKGISRKADLLHITDIKEGFQLDHYDIRLHLRILLLVTDSSLKL